MATTTTGSPTQPMPIQGIGAVSGVAASGQSITGPGWQGHDYQSSGGEHGWFIQTQSMQFNYERVPIGEVSSIFVGLSSVDIATNINATVMIIEGAAWTEGHHSTDWYACSSPPSVPLGCMFQQGQRFALDVISSIDNVTYGTPVLGTFGPKGSCYTYQDYYKRRYATSEDKDFNHFLVNAYTFSAVMLEDMGDCEYNSTSPTAGYADLFGSQITKHRFFSVHTTLGLGSGREFCKNWAFDVVHCTNRKGGPYATFQDATADVQQVVDCLGHQFRNGSLQSAHGVALPAIPYFSDRHDWS